MRQLGWISLFAVLLIVACGPPEVHDINGGSGGISDDDDSGDDDDDAGTGTTTPTPTGTGAQPTLTNVPSFATWQAQIKPMLCSACHSGSAGGFSYSGIADNDKFSWFSSICNRDGGALNEGMQSFNPPTGRWRNYMAGQVVSHDAISANQTTLNNWYAQGAASTPPDCNTYYDLANSN